jgi:hypothetical protein
VSERFRNIHLSRCREVGRDLREPVRDSMEHPG